jgi:YjbE family integral membrane protein
MEWMLDISWVTVGQIILIDILLGGDNAIVIAMACRQLPEDLRHRGLVWGTFGAIIARIVLLVIASLVLNWTWIKILGGALLYWIALKMLLSDDEGSKEITAHEKLIHAIRTIVVADVVMSLDNVLAVASATQVSDSGNQIVMMVIGVLVSIPVILFGSSLFLKLIDRFPSLIFMGAAMLAYIGVVMSTTALVSVALLQHDFLQMHVIIPLINVKLSVIGIIGAISIAIFAKLSLHAQKDRS